MHMPLYNWTFLFFYLSNPLSMEYYVIMQLHLAEQHIKFILPYDSFGSFSKPKAYSEYIQSGWS